MALGDRQSNVYLWEDVHALTMAGVPVKSLKRQIGAVTDMALDTVVNLAMPGGPGPVGGGPAMMTVRVESRDCDTELSTYMAAAVGYSPTEIDLSQALLSRLTEGAATMATTMAAMSEWGRAWEEAHPGERSARSCCGDGWARTCPADHAAGSGMRAGRK